MTRISARTLLPRLLVAAVLAAAPAGGVAVAAQANGGDSSAVAVNAKDGASVFKLTFQIRQVMGETVDNQNAAVAYSSCEACQTVAISIQVLLVQGDVTNFSPENAAIAINENCTLCDTLATAYQFAVGVGTKLKFTADGRRQIADIRHQLEQLRHSGLSGPELATQVDSLMGQLKGVLGSQVVGVQQPAAGTDGQSADPASGSGGGAQPEPGAAPTGAQPQDGTSTTPSGQQGDGSTSGDGTSTTPGDSGTGTQTTPDGSDGTGTSTTPTSPSGP